MIQSYVLLWLLGILLIAASWYLPGAGGFFWLGGLTLLFGFALAYFRRGE
jgi:membrane-bound ClpP family serine protease